MISSIAPPTLTRTSSDEFPHSCLILLLILRPAHYASPASDLLNICMLLGLLHSCAVLGIYDSTIADLKARGAQTLVAAGEGGGLYLSCVQRPGRLCLAGAEGHQPATHEPLRVGVFLYSDHRCQCAVDHILAITQ